MKNTRFSTLTFLSVLLLAGCGGGSSGEDEITPPIVTKTKGYLIDAPIVGVNYECGDTKAKTIAGGEFACVAAPVTFKIGELTLGTISAFTADKNVYLQDLLGLERTSYSNPELIGLASLLQSLDDDGDIADAITIPDHMAAQFGEGSTGKTWEELAAMAGVTLVSATNAVAHLLNIPDLSNPAPLARFNGTWINTDADTNSITKVIIANNGSQPTVHAFGRCTPTDCDWGEINAQAYGKDVSANLLTSTRVMAAKYDDNFPKSQLMISRIGDVLNIEKLTFFDNSYDNRKNFVSINTFKREGAASSNPFNTESGVHKLEDFSGTWINVDAQEGLSRVILSNSGFQPTIQIFGNCVPTECEWGEQNVYAHGDSISSNLTTSTRVMTSSYDFDFSVKDTVIRLVGDLMQVEIYTQFNDDRSNYAKRYILRKEP